MEFTWKQFLELIEITFEITRSALSDYLEIDKSTISNLYTGKTHRFTRRNSYIYEKIFDPTYPKSLVCKKNTGTPQKEIEDSLLDTLKQIVESENWTEQTKEIPSNKYKNYVMGLIKLARANSSKSPEKEENVSPENIPQEDIPQESISSNPTEYTPLGNSSAIKEDAKISIPLQYQKCLYCEYFHIAKTVHKYISDPLGTCTVHAQVKKSTSPACDNFLENIGKITQESLIGNFSYNKFHL